MTAPFPAVPNLPQHVEAELHDHDMRHHPRGYVRSGRESKGRCSFRFEAFGIVGYCWAYDMPPTGLCCHHAALLEVTP